MGVKPYISGECKTRVESKVVVLSRRTELSSAGSRYRLAKATLVPTRRAFMTEAIATVPLVKLIQYNNAQRTLDVDFHLHKHPAVL